MKYCATTILTLLLAISYSLNAQSIRGRILSEKGEAISYAIAKAVLPDTLVFSAVGYQSYSVALTEKILKDTLLEVVLLAARSSLNDVVVTGNGAARKTYMLEEDEVGAARVPEESGRASKASPSIDKLADVSLGRRSVDKERGFKELRSAPPQDDNGKKFVSLDSITPQSGNTPYATRKLTAGEVNDFNKWTMWEDFSANEFKSFSEHWNLFTTERYCVLLQNNQHSALPGREVYLLNKSTGDTIWQAVTDNTGKAELWAGVNMQVKEGAEYAIACTGCKKDEHPKQFANGINKITLQAPCFTNNNVDIAFVVDATGSMADEIEFLKTDMENVLQKANADYEGVNLNAATVVYRDSGDEYLTKHVDFDDNLLTPLNFIKMQSASGGGDMPEAVEVALHTAMDSLHWSKEARTRLLFLVLDAPPHDYARDEMFVLMKKAAAMGIRIIPIVCSGADKSTEFMMRNLALATNGTYVFLTDDSGIGLSHIKPTTDSYNVELLSNLLPRLIKQMVFLTGCGNYEEGGEPVAQTPDNKLQIKIMPNPTQGDVLITSNKDVKELYVTDFTGKILQRIKSGARNIHISLGEYPNGMYMIKYVTEDNEWGAEKIVLLR